MRGGSDGRDGAAVDDVLGADDAGGAVGNEEGNESSNFLGAGGTTQRDPAAGSMSCFSAASRVVPVFSAMWATSRSAAVVWTKPGLMELIRMPSGATSLARRSL